MSPETPGAIQDGGELGYSLVHAYGAAFDNPDLIVADAAGLEPATLCLEGRCSIRLS